MLDLAQGWSMKIDRGPDWLFIRLACEPDTGVDYSTLADSLWSVLSQHFVYRVVLEMDDVPMLPSSLLGQLVRLHKRLHSQNGLMRVAGLSPGNQQVLRSSRLETRFPVYRNREEAVMGFRPPQPR